MVLSFLLELDQLPCDHFDRLEIGFASLDRLVKKPHLEFTEGFVEVKSSIPANKFSMHTAVLYILQDLVIVSVYKLGGLTLLRE